MQGFLDCVRPPRIDFWAILHSIVFTQKITITREKITVSEKNLNLSWRLSVKGFAKTVGLLGQSKVSFIVFALQEWIFELFLLKKKTVITQAKMVILEKKLNLFWRLSIKRFS